MSRRRGSGERAGIVGFHQGMRAPAMPGSARASAADLLAALRKAADGDRPARRLHRHDAVLPAVADLAGKMVDRSRRQRLGSACETAPGPSPAQPQHRLGAEHPRRSIVIFWGTLTGAVAAVMLLAGGDEPSEALSGLQRVTIVAALPFILVMLLLCFALAKDLRRDPLSLRRRLATSVVERAIRTGVEQHRGVQFDLVTKHECGETCADSDCPGGTPTGSIPAVETPPRSADRK